MHLWKLLGKPLGGLQKAPGEALGEALGETLKKGLGGTYRKLLGKLVGAYRKPL
jgi:hypothetical protein